MKHLLKKILVLTGVLVLSLSLAAPAFADAPVQGEPADAPAAVENPVSYTHLTLPTTERV